MANVVTPKPWAGTTFDPPTPIGLEAIQHAIMARLKSRMPIMPNKSSVKVENFPDRGPKYRDLNNKAILLVRWDANTFGNLRDVGLVVQEQEIKWCIVVGARSMGWDYGQIGELGAFQLMHFVRRSLGGYFTPGAARRLYPLTEVYRENQEGTVWWYECMYAHSVMNVQEYCPPNFPVFTQGRMLEKGGQTGVVADAQSFTFGSGGTINLGQENVSAVIVESEDLSVTYELGTDYTVDVPNGIVTRLASGSIPPLAEVQVAFVYSEVVTVVSGGGTAPTAPTN